MIQRTGRPRKFYDGPAMYRFGWVQAEGETARFFKKRRGPYRRPYRPKRFRFSRSPLLFPIVPSAFQ